MRQRKQNSVVELFEEQRMRKSAIRTDLLRIFGVLPSRSLLRHRNPVDEVGRGEMPYEPAEKLLLMIRDGADAARRNCTKEKQLELAHNIHAFFATLERYALEPLAVQEETQILPLLLEETRVQCDGDPVQDMAKVCQTPETLSRVARHAERQARISTRVARAAWGAINRAGLSLVRSSTLQVG